MLPVGSLKGNPLNQLNRFGALPPPPAAPFDEFSAAAAAATASAPPATLFSELGAAAAAAAKALGVRPEGHCARKLAAGRDAGMAIPPDPRAAGSW